jgi:hypothetical protein
MLTLKKHNEIISNIDNLLNEISTYLTNQFIFSEKVNGLIKKHDKQNILMPCSIDNIKLIIDFNILKKYINKDIESNIEYYNDTNMTYTISNPTKAEWIIYKSIKNSLWIGKGNNKADVFLELLNTNIYIDVGVLTLNGNQTNEKSIMQNFTEGNNLDELFIKKNGNEAINIFKNKLINKYSINNEINTQLTNYSPINNKINKYYYVLFICHKQNIYLTCFNFNNKNIKNMQFESFIGSVTEYKNILVKNFIDKIYGNVKLYKSKKRLELRLNKQIINEYCSIKIY